MTLVRLTPAKLLSATCSNTWAYLLLASAPALAQDQGAAAPEIVNIIGTRLTGPGATAASPVLSITSEDIQSSQAVAVEEFFKNLPAAAPAIGPATNNGNIGGATIDLRGLGSNRTLVLINGRRVVPFNLGGTVDTNIIPLALLGRVDVATGGASAVYGADAVAGVANFNLKRRAPGLELSSFYGKSGSGDTGRSRNAVTWGIERDQGRANLVLGVESTRAYPLFQGDRVAGASSFDSVTGLPSGSGITIPALISVSKGAGGSDTLAGNWQIDPATGRLIQPVVNYNFNPQNYYMTGLDRLQTTALASYVLNEQAELYADLFHTNSTVLTTLAESGTALNIYNVPIGNPFIPAEMRQQLCARRGIAPAHCIVGDATLVPVTIGRRFTEMPYRHNDFDNRTLQATLGIKGSLAQGWHYDSYWSHGRSRQTQTRRNFSSLSRLDQALNAVDTDTCANPTGRCVPLNVFGPAGSLTPAMIEYIRQDALLRQSVNQDVIAATAAGDLADVVSPWARRPLNLALGAEQRKMSADTASDAASQLPGEVIGSGSPTPDRSGAFTMREVSLEALLPLAQQRPALHALHLTAGYRYTMFSTSQTRQHYDSCKYGGAWAPLATLRFHGMIQQAVRAPNINELFAPQTSSSLANLAIDPCQLNLVSQSQASLAGTLSHLCLQTGVPLSVLGSLPRPSAGQINSQSGGNPSLEPERAKTVTLGAVFQPGHRFQLSLDYYRIDIAHAISRPSVTDVLDACYGTALNPTLAVTPACALVQRSQVNGGFNGNDAIGIVTPLSNQGRQSTSGFDLNLRYNMPLADDWGHLDLQFALNQVQSFNFQAAPDAVKRQCLGYYSTACGGPNYRRKFSQRSNWSIGPYVLGYHWRYLSAAVEEPGGIAYLPAYSSIRPYHYLDLSFAWQVRPDTRLHLSLANAFNRLPPIVGGTIGSTSTNSGNTFPQNYDVVGRYVTLGATFKF